VTNVVSNFFWNCLGRLAVEVRQFAKKLFRFFVIFVTEGGIFGSPGDTEGGRRRGGSEKVISGMFEINASTCQGKKAQIEFFKN